MIPDYPEWTNTSNTDYTPQVMEWTTRFNDRSYRISTYHNASDKDRYRGNVYLDEVSTDTRGKAVPELAHVAFDSKQQEEDAIADFTTRLEAYVVLRTI